MRLSRLATLSNRRKSQKLGSSSRVRTKHKRLDAICEKVYSRNHRVLESESIEGNVGGSGSIGNESELRRSSRVRRAPILLDASPPLPKKRRKIDKTIGIDSVDRVRRKEWVNSESLCSTSKDLEEESGNWRSRLRSRPNNVGYLLRGVGSSSPKGKRKLFADIDGFNDGLKLEVGGMNDKEEAFGGGNVTVIKSQRPGNLKASNISTNERQQIGYGNVIEDQNEKKEIDLLEEKDRDNLPSNIGEGGGHEAVENHSSPLVEPVEESNNELPTTLHLGDCMVNDNGQSMECDEMMEEPGDVNETEYVNDALAVNGPSTYQEEDGRSHDKPLEDEIFKKAEKLNNPSLNALGVPHIKKGRRCGLCGGGTDGKPPKILLQDGAGSDNEAYCGSSGAEEPNYDMWDGFGDEPGWLGRLLGPINDRFGIAGIWVHQNCAVWSPEVYFAGLGCLKNVRAALCRGRLLKCSRCHRRGATIGCRVDRCTKTYHLPCARTNGCIFDHRKFLIACTDHRYLFQPHGSKYFHWVKKMKVKKLKMEIRKLSNDALRKDVEAEEKWLENCGEDEEFLKRESKRLHRDLLRIAPVYIGGAKSDNKMQFQGWESVAGLQNVIQCLKEVVILPLLYPEFFSNIGLTPPRGVLLHGYPGTGKTLVVRSLIGSCAHGDKRIAYFARKGADCLGKYVGDAERQLRLLFQVAEKSQPSIIFFDEIDGLAPARTRQQDQTHNSVVSTLLSLLDGLKSRGSVVVIGATNRPDAVDPALRRPGRFDREVYFPLPSVKDREAILSIQTQKWPKPVTGSLLKWIARRTPGFAGADLQALCTQAAIVALKRSCPLQKLLSEAEGKSHNGKRPPLPSFNVEERDWLEALSCAPPPCSRREAGMAANDVVSSPLPVHLLPCVLQPLSTFLVSVHLDGQTWLPLALSKAASLIKSTILSVLDKKKVSSENWWSHVNDLLQEEDVARELISNLSCKSILVGDACYVGSDALAEDAGDDTNIELTSLRHLDTCTNTLQNASLSVRSGFRILISGNPRSGQRHLASCILHCFVGNVQIQKVDLATISQEGHGDVVHGVTQILMGCAGLGSCIIFMPRIDLWAVDACFQEEGDYMGTSSESPENSSIEHNNAVDGKISCSSRSNSAEPAEHQNASAEASHLWNTFIEQVESLCITSSLMVLATSELPFLSLPLRVRLFFETQALNCSLSTPLKDAIPRFSIMVGGDFDYNMVIDSSAANLSKDLAQYFVQLIYHRRHINASSVVALDAAESAPTNGELGLAVDSLCLKQCPGNPALRNSLPPVARYTKGKSNLMLAISTLGFQILQYPHFAELCWATSKLKEGPSAETDGPWKEWPFNSCIICPKDLLETTKQTAVWSSANTKRDKNFGLVRGLVAVGLLAYRGMYTSLREVASEVRKVLELLAGQIQAKIEAGKDRDCFVRLLSQLAYLEDVVNSWAYTLRSLEIQGQVVDEDPRMVCMGSSNTCKTIEGSLFQGDADVTNKNMHDTGGSSLKLDATYTESAILEKVNSGYVNQEGRVSSPEEPLPHLPSLNSSPVVQFQSSDGADIPWCIELPNGTNSVNSNPCGVESSGDIIKVGDVNESISNGYACTDSALRPKDVPHGSGDLGCVKDSDLGKEGNKDNPLSSAQVHMPSEDGNPNSCKRNIDINVPLNSVTDLPPDPPGVVCLYRCCSECLVNLQHLVRKNLMYRWGLKRSKWTVEDVHDVVTSTSVQFHSEVRNFCLGENSIESLNAKPHCSYKKSTEGEDTRMCRCKNSGDRLIIPKECSCHRRSKTANAKASSWNPREIELDLMYRDGVLISVDPEKVVSFHCKFETLCLCSLIEWIDMTKQPSD